MSLAIALPTARPPRLPRPCLVLFVSFLAAAVPAVSNGPTDESGVTGVSVSFMRNELQSLRQKLDSDRGYLGSKWEKRVADMENQISDLEKMITKLAAREGRTLVTVSHHQLQDEIDRLKSAVGQISGGRTKVWNPESTVVTPKLNKTGVEKAQKTQSANDAASQAQLRDKQQQAEQAASVAHDDGNKGNAIPGNTVPSPEADGTQHPPSPGADGTQHPPSAGAGETSQKPASVPSRNAAADPESNAHVPHGGPVNQPLPRADRAGQSRPAVAHGGNDGNAVPNRHSRDDGDVDVNVAMPFGGLEPFGREDTARELTEASIRESDAMVDQLERAEVAEEKRAVFRALTRLRGAAITSFDGVARAHSGNIDEYANRFRWRKAHPIQHLANEESDTSRWAFPA